MTRLIIAIAVLLFIVPPACNSCQFVNSCTANKPPLQR